MNTWPDGGMTPFRSEKNTSWEGAYRVPCMVRFPGQIKAGSVSNEIVSHLDWFPTILAVASEPDIIEKLKKGHKAGSKSFKVHLDGHNVLPYLTGKESKSPRKGFIYFTDDGDVAALRYDNWKMLFMEQRVETTLKIWLDRLWCCARPISSICAWIRTNAHSRPRIRFWTGCSGASICSCFKEFQCRRR